MIESFLEKLEIPNNCSLDKRVFKKLFQENAKLDVTDKKALKDDVVEIRWLYTLKPSTINIARYADKLRDYPEVAILHIALSSPARAKRIAALVQRAIPYPLILLFSHEAKLAVSVCDKRINQADKSKWVIEHNWITEWIDLNSIQPHQQAFIDECSIKGMSFKDFHSFYQDFTSRVIALNCANKTGSYSRGSTAESSKCVELLAELEKLEAAKSELRNRLKNEKQMGKQVEINGKIKSITDEAESILAKLKHGEAA